MRAVAHSAAPPDQAPYAAAEAAFAAAKAYLCSREAQQMSESDLERELHRRGQELMRKLLQGHLDQRSPGEAAGPVVGADDVERSQRRVHERHLETTFSQKPLGPPTKKSRTHFRYGGSSNGFTTIAYYTDTGRFEIEFSAALTSSAGKLAVVVDGGTPLAFETADSKTGKTRTWNNPGFSLSSGPPVSLSLLAPPTLTIEALNDDIPHGDGDAAAAGVAEFRITRSEVPEDETHDTSLEFNTLWKESSEPGDSAFEPGYATKVLKHLALDEDDQGDPVCTITYALRAGNGYVVGSPSEATVNVTGTGCTDTNEGEDPLTASFEDLPSSHDGEKPFSFPIAFNLDITASAADMRDHALTVSGGSVTSASQVDNRADLWTLTVTPAGEKVVSIQVPVGRDCAEAGAICTANGGQLSTGVAGLVPFTDAVTTRRNTLTASFENVPTEHDGENAFSFQVAFSEDIHIRYETLRDDSFTVTEGDVTRARRVDGRDDLWEITVEPDSREAMTIRLPGNRACGTAGAVCTGGDDRRPLTNSPSATVAGPPTTPLTASFSEMPAEHTGDSFTFGLTFSEDFGVGYRKLRDDAFSVTGGAVDKARRQTAGDSQAWNIEIEPDGYGAVTITLPETTDCDASGAICTGDGRPLSHSLAATVAGPVGISIADARVEEAAGALLAFTVTLSRAASGTLTLDYATADGSAQAGVDYTGASGTLTFDAGESSTTIEVAVLDDAHDEGEETFTLTLSNPSAGRLTDDEATGTIENRDPLPKALLARFGRTAAVHVVEHVEERLQAPREPGFRGRFAGRELRRGMERDIALNFIQQLGGTAGAGQMPGATSGAAGMPGPAGGVRMAAAAGPMGARAPAGMATGPMAMTAGPTPGGAGPADAFNSGGLLQMGLGGGDVLTGSAFALNRRTGSGGILSFWSRGARSHFSGREGALSLGGDVLTTMFGADYAKGPLVAGLSLSHSRGLGHYAGVAGGQVASAVTGLYPWIGYKATDRITVWGVTGYGSGRLLLTPDTGAALEAGLSMGMAAAGTRGEIVARGAGGFGLAFKADALWVGTGTEGVDGPAGRMAATEAAVTRFRTALESSRDFVLADRMSLAPSVEVGLRHDGGDAETGAGMDVGAGVILADMASGLAVDLRVRTLLVHQAQGFSERGMAVSFSYNPTPSTPMGFTARVAPSWGGQATSGAQALWGRENMAGMAHRGLAQGNRLDGEVGYGLPVGTRFVGTPRVGFSTSEYGQDYRVGYGLGILERESLTFELGVDAQRRTSPLLGGTSNGVLGRATVGW